MKSSMATGDVEQLQLATPRSAIQICPGVPCRVAMAATIARKGCESGVLLVNISPPSGKPSKAVANVGVQAGQPTEPKV